MEDNPQENRFAVVHNLLTSTDDKSNELRATAYQMA